MYGFIIAGMAGLDGLREEKSLVGKKGLGI